MAFLFPALLFVVFITCAAFLYREGIWGNAIVLVNVILSALLAVNFWEPVARKLEGFSPSLTFLHDMVALWFLFSLFMVIFGTATRSVSRFKVRFKQLHEQIGSAVLAVLVGWVMVCFTTMTLHTAPLARNFMFGGFQPEKRMFFGLAPDRQWLGLVKYTSKGAFKRWNTREFDPRNQFIAKYAQRRDAVQTNVETSFTVRVDGDSVGRAVQRR